MGAGGFGFRKFRVHNDDGPGDDGEEAEEEKEGTG